MTPRSALAACLALAAMASEAHAPGRVSGGAPAAEVEATATAIAAACARRSWKREPAGHLLRDDCVGQLVLEPVAPAAARARQPRVAVALPESPLANMPVEDDFGED